MAQHVACTGVEARLESVLFLLFTRGAIGDHNALLVLIEGHMSDKTVRNDTTLDTGRSLWWL